VAVYKQAINVLRDKRVLLSRYPLGFDTLIVDIMGPDFKMADELRTKHATVRDLLAHRVGMAHYEMTMMMGLDLSHSVQEYCRSVVLYVFMYICVCVCVVFVCVVFLCYLVCAVQIYVSVYRCKHVCSLVK